MNVELFSIGNELVRGFTVDSNSAYLARHLESAGFEVVLHHTVGDDRARAAALIERAMKRSGLIVMTGGLGPTGDDVTREMVCDAAGIGLALDEVQWDRIRRLLQSFGIPLEEGHRQQAMIPLGARVLPNHVGTAPGFLVTSGDCRIAALPGVPAEMRPMVTGELLPALTDGGADRVDVSTRVMRLFGLPESQVGEVVRRWMADDSEPHVGLTASRATLSLYISSRGGDEAERRRRIAQVEEAVLRECGEAVFGGGEDELVDVVGRELIRTRQSIAVAESCTGGMVAEQLTRVAGISSVFEEGAVTYGNAAKVRTLGVPADLIELHGAVSEPVARAMAEGIRRRADASVGVAITGIAGPGGGTAEKPVGLVFIGVSYRGRTRVRECRFAGSRQAVRLRSALTALDEVRRLLAGSDEALRPSSDL